FQATVKGNAIDVQAARARQLTFYLSDRLLNLSEPVTIRVNGKTVHDKRAERSFRVAIDEIALLNDTERFAAARVTVAVPDLAAGEKWLASLAPKIEPGPLAYWEDFAMLTLKETRPSFPAVLEMMVEATPPAAKVTSVPEGSLLRVGDLIQEFDDEP